MMSYRDDYVASALQSLRKSAEADLHQAETSLLLMLTHPAGVGDHSTGDLHQNLNEALSKLCDAKDRIQTLESFVFKYESIFGEEEHEDV